MANGYTAPVIAGLAVGIVFVILFSFVVIAPYMSHVPSSGVTHDNPYGIDAKVVFAHAYSAISCPMRPCDTSGFVLTIVSRNDVMILGYEVCNTGSTCVYSSDMGISHLFGSPKGFEDDTLQSTSGLTSYLGKKSNWSIGDTVSIKVKAASAIERQENNITTWEVDTSRPAKWIDLGQSKIMEIDII